MSMKFPMIRNHHAVYILGHLVHHWVRPPGGLADKQSSALFFWFVESIHKVSALFLFTHPTAFFRRFTNSSLDSNFVGIVSVMRPFRRPHAFSIALKSCDATPYTSRKLCSSRWHRFHLLPGCASQCYLTHPNNACHDSF